MEREIGIEAISKLSMRPILASCAGNGGRAFSCREKGNEVFLLKKISFRKDKFWLYILGKLLAVGLSALVLVFAFSTAMQTSNIYMLAKDAFAKRTSVILMPLENKDTDLLDSIFTAEYLEESGLATQATNASYTINSYDERTDVSITVVFPWQRTAKVKVTNTVQDISAEIAPGAITVNEVDRFIESGEYTLTMVKEDGGWKVSDLQLDKDTTIDQSEEYPIPTKEPEELYEEEVPEPEPSASGGSQ